MDKIQTMGASQLALSTKEAFTSAYTVVKCNERYQSIRTVQQAIELKELSLSVVKAEFGVEFVQAYLSLWIVNINQFLNLRYSMTELQIEETSRMIIGNFYNLTIPEIYLVFNNAKLGYYNRFYDRIDGVMILDWFSKYMEERCSYFEIQSIEESNVFRGYTRYNRSNDKKL